MKKLLYPVLITSLLVLAGFTFYSLYHSAAPLQTIALDDDTKLEKPIDLQKLSPIKNNHQEKILPKHKVVSLEKEIQAQSKNIKIETPEETQAIYDSIRPDNYEETMEEANVAFATIETVAEEAEIAFLEEEANRQE